MVWRNASFSMLNIAGQEATMRVSGRFIDQTLLTG
jgi:hypothetical protein